MKTVKNALNFYVNSNLHVAFACFCLVEISRCEFGLEKTMGSWFVFFATILAYNFIRFAQLKRIHASISLWIRSRSRVLVFMNVLALAGLLYTASKIEIKPLLLLFPFLLATGLYVFPGSGYFQGFRNLPGVKLFLISVTWAGVTVLFPLQVEPGVMDGGVWTVFVQRFLFVFAVTIPFDIRDLQLDDPELGTLPQKIGVAYAKMVALAALLCFSLLELLRLDHDLLRSAPALVTAFIAAVMILRASVYQGRFFSAFWIEALPILWYVLVLMLVC